MKTSLKFIVKFSLKLSCRENFVRSHIDGMHHFAACYDRPDRYSDYYADRSVFVASLL